MATAHAGRNAMTPRSQYVLGERAGPFRLSRLTAQSVTITPRSAAEEERSTDGGKGVSEFRSVNSPSTDRMLISQAGRSAARPISQYRPGDGLDSRLLRYAITNPVPITPMIPSRIDHFVMSSLYPVPQNTPCVSAGMNPVRLWPGFGLSPNSAVKRTCQMSTQKSL